MQGTQWFEEIDVTPPGWQKIQGDPAALGAAIVAIFKTASCKRVVLSYDRVMATMLVSVGNVPSLGSDPVSDAEP